MSLFSKNSSKYFLFIVLALFIVGINSQLIAQDVMGISYSYENFPSVKLADPITGDEDYEIQASSWSVGAAFPLQFADGKILMLNNIVYKRVDFSHKNYPQGGSGIDQAQSVQYTAFVIDSLSETWSLIVVMTPGLASDFRGDLSMDDFTLQAVFGFIKKYSEKFQLGFGLAYIRDFGSPIPLPFLYIDWKIADKLSFGGLVPMDMKLKYELSKGFDLGVSMKVRGDRYHGNPDDYDVDNPQLEYSEGTLSPFVQIHFTEWMHLNVEGGFAVYRNFEFLDGNKSKGSYDLEPTSYLRAGLVLGM